jgi:hypothetical protein
MIVEAEDLSVSQIVRRALRNELKVIANQGVPAPDVAAIAKILTKAFREAEKKAFYGDPVPGAPVGNTVHSEMSGFREDDTLLKVADILQNKPRGRK